MARKGIRRVTGGIVADDTFFDTRGLERFRKGAGYAPTGALRLMGIGVEVANLH
jgi:hypothetical protein